jgi:hypothetical protein
VNILQELTEIYMNGSEEEQANVLHLVEDYLGEEKVWTPNDGPQMDAYYSEADVLLYGGAAGGGKTHLELGWAINEAQSGIIFRRETTQTDGLEKEGKNIIGDNARFNGTHIEWEWPNGKSLKLAGMNQPDDWRKHAGRERDYFAFDEAGEFLEMQVAQIIAWLRAPEGQRTRVILGSNPPRTSEGLWMIKWFAPWLDERYPEPALPGELRWAVGISTEMWMVKSTLQNPIRLSLQASTTIRTETHRNTVPSFSHSPSRCVVSFSTESSHPVWKIWRTSVSLPNG